MRPLKDGVIADFDVTEKMLRYFIQKVTSIRLRRSRASSSAFRPASPRWRSARCETQRSGAGAREVFMIEEPMAAAIGVGPAG